MRVRIICTVDVDPKAYAEEYGIEVSEVREEIKRRFEWVPQEIIDELGLAPVEEE